MRQKSVHPESPSERIVKNIRSATRKRHSSEEKIKRPNHRLVRRRHEPVWRRDETGHRGIRQYVEDG